MNIRSYITYIFYITTTIPLTNPSIIPDAILNDDEVVDVTTDRNSTITRRHTIPFHNHKLRFYTKQSKNNERFYFDTDHDFDYTTLESGHGRSQIPDVVTGSVKHDIPTVRNQESNWGRDDGDPEVPEDSLNYYNSHTGGDVGAPEQSDDPYGAAESGPNDDLNGGEAARYTSSSRYDENAKSRRYDGREDRERAHSRFLMGDSKYLGVMKDDSGEERFVQANERDEGIPPDEREEDEDDEESFDNNGDQEDETPDSREPEITGSDDYEPDQGNERDLEEEESNYEYEDNNPHEDANDEALDEESENEDEKNNDDGVPAGNRADIQGYDGGSLSYFSKADNQNIMMSRGRKKLVDDMLGGALNHNDTSNLEDIQSTTAEFTSNNYKDASMDDLGGEMMAGTSTSSSMDDASSRHRMGGSGIQIHGGMRIMRHRHGPMMGASKAPGSSPTTLMSDNQVRIGGKLVKMQGGFKTASIKVRLSESLKKWDWRQYIMGFKYEAVGRASVGILVIGSMQKHLAMVQRWIYNLVLMFKRGSYVSLASFGAFSTLISDFRTFKASSEIKTMCQQIKDSDGQDIGAGLEFYYKLFESVKEKENLKMVLFLFVKGGTDGTKEKMKEYGQKFSALGVKIFVIALGSGASLSELQVITKRQRIFMVMNYKAVILGGGGLKIAGREGAKQSIFVIFQRRFARWLGLQVGVSSMQAARYHGERHKEWWFRIWGWYHYLGIRYGSIGRANLAFVVDGSNAELIMFIQRYVYNYIRLFQLQGTYVTIMAYGRDQYRVASWVSFVSPQEVQKYCASIPFIQTKYRNTGAALEEMVKLYSVYTMKNNNPNILFLVVTGTSTDKEKLKDVGPQFKALGVNVWTIAAGTEGQLVSKELKGLATQPSNIVAGGITALVQKEIFTSISSSLTKVAGTGNAMTTTTGNAAMLRIQSKWNWKSDLRTLRYGYLSRSNIAFLLDGVDPLNFGYVRRMIYNIIRMYTLSGSYVTIMVHGSRVYRVCNFAQIRKPADIKRLTMAIPKVANGVRKTGAALSQMLKAFSEAPPGNPNVLYVLTQGQSADDVTAPANLLRKYGIKTFACGMGDKASPKDLATIAFGSTTIFKSAFNGLGKTISMMQPIAAGISGTVSKACGRSGHIGCRKSDIVKNWQWKTYGISFSYESVDKASVGFVIDGTNVNHFDVLQKLVYNIFKLFAPGSSASMITYGTAIDKRMATFRKYRDMTAFQTACAAISYKGGVKQRKTGEALREYIKYFNEASAVNKKVLFVLTTAKADDDVTEPAKMLVNKGVSIFAIGIGKNVQPTDLKSISRYFLVTKWRGLLTSMVKIQNSLIKVCGKSNTVEPDVGTQPAVPAGEPDVKPPLSPPSGSFIASSSTQTITRLQTLWDWSKLIEGIKYGSLNSGELVFVVDVSKQENMDVITRFVYNIIMLFKLSDTSVTLIIYGATSRVVLVTRQFYDGKEVQYAIKEKLRASLNDKCKTGQAMMFVRKKLLPKLQSSQRKGIVFVISRTKSSDDISKDAEQLKGAGLTMVAVGVGSDYSQEELALIASTGHLALSGNIGDMAAFIGRIQFGLTMIVNGLTNDSLVSLSSMGGEGGDLLTTSVLNTVQTGSVPSETAGQPGTSNTGASAGDSQGGDTGGGAAGAVEMGGTAAPTDDTGAKVSIKQSSNEVGGGDTGAGGSDVAAGGPIVGVTNSDKDTNKPAPGEATNDETTEVNGGMADEVNGGSSGLKQPTPAGGSTTTTSSSGKVTVNGKTTNTGVDDNGVVDKTGNGDANGQGMSDTEASLDGQNNGNDVANNANNGKGVATTQEGTQPEGQLVIENGNTQTVDNKQPSTGKTDGSSEELPDAEDTGVNGQVSDNNGVNGNGKISGGDGTNENVVNGQGESISNNNGGTKTNQNGADGKYDMQGDQEVEEGGAVTTNGPDKTEPINDGAGSQTENVKPDEESNGKIGVTNKGASSSATTVERLGGGHIGKTAENNDGGKSTGTNAGIKGAEGEETQEVITNGGMSETTDGNMNGPTTTGVKGENGKTGGEAQLEESTETGGSTVGRADNTVNDNRNPVNENSINDKNQQGTESATTANANMGGNNGNDATGQDGANNSDNSKNTGDANDSKSDGSVLANAVDTLVGDSEQANNNNGNNNGNNNNENNVNNVNIGSNDNNGEVINGKNGDTAGNEVVTDGTATTKVNNAKQNGNTGSDSEGNIPFKENADGQMQNTNNENTVDSSQGNAVTVTNGAGDATTGDGMQEGGIGNDKPGMPQEEGVSNAAGDSIHNGGVVINGDASANTNSKQGNSGMVTLLKNKGVALEEGKIKPENDGTVISGSPCANGKCPVNGNGDSGCIGPVYICQGNKGGTGNSGIQKNPQMTKVCTNDNGGKKCTLHRIKVMNKMLNNNQGSHIVNALNSPQNTKHVSYVDDGYHTVRVTNRAHTNGGKPQVADETSVKNIGDKGGYAKHGVQTQIVENGFDSDIVTRGTLRSGKLIDIMSTNREYDVENPGTVRSLKEKPKQKTANMTDEVRSVHRGQEVLGKGGKVKNAVKSSPAAHITKQAKAGSTRTIQNGIKSSNLPGVASNNSDAVAKEDRVIRGTVTATKDDQEIDTKMKMDKEMVE